MIAEKETGPHPKNGLNMGSTSCNRPLLMVSNQLQGARYSSYVPLEWRQEDYTLVSGSR